MFGEAPILIASRLPSSPVYPADHNLVSWTSDPVFNTASSALTNGVLYVAKLHLSLEAVLTKLYWNVSTAGATPTSGQNSIGIYNPAGARLLTANVDADVSSIGLKTTSFAALSVAPPFVWAAFVFNAATPPSLARTASVSNSVIANVGLTAASIRCGTNGAGLTALPTSITPSSATGAINMLWAAVGA